MVKLAREEAGSYENVNRKFIESGLYTKLSLMQEF